MFFGESIEINTESDRIEHPVKGKGEIINISEDGKVTIRYNDWPHEESKIDIMHSMTLRAALFYDDLKIVRVKKSDFGIACQKCFNAEATMQDDDGIYLCSECYRD